jgi:RNA polymerase sigma-70 factor (ECF subfamily)
LRLDQKLQSRIDPSDVVQDTELEACQRIDDYLDAPTLSFRIWLRRIAQDRLVDARRRHLVAECRTVEREMPLPEHSSVLLAGRIVGQSSTPSAQAASRELAQKVRRAMFHLSELDREIMLMVNCEGLTSREIGQVLDMERSAVRQRYGRALRELKELLAQ